MSRHTTRLRRASILDRPAAAGGIGMKKHLYKGDDEVKSPECQARWQKPFLSMPIWQGQR